MCSWIPCCLLVYIYVVDWFMCVFRMKSLPCSRPRPHWVVDFKCIEVIQWSTFGWNGRLLVTSVLHSNSAMLTSIRMKIWRKREERRHFTMVCEWSMSDFHSWSYNPATIRWSTFGAYRYRVTNCSLTKIIIKKDQKQVSKKISKKKSSPCRDGPMHECTGWQSTKTQCRHMHSIICDPILENPTYCTKCCFELFTVYTIFECPHIPINYL